MILLILAIILVVILIIVGCYYQRKFIWHKEKFTDNHLTNLYMTTFILGMMIGCFVTSYAFVTGDKLNEPTARDYVNGKVKMIINRDTTFVKTEE